SGSVAVSSTSNLPPGVTSKIVPASCSGTVQLITVSGSTRNSGGASWKSVVPAGRHRTLIAASRLASPLIRTWIPIVCRVGRSVRTSVIVSAFWARAVDAAGTTTATAMTRARIRRRYRRPTESSYSQLTSLGAWRERDLDGLGRHPGHDRQRRAG